MTWIECVLPLPPPRLVTCNLSQLPTNIQSPRTPATMAVAAKPVRNLCTVLADDFGTFRQQATCFCWAAGIRRKPDFEAIFGRKEMQSGGIMWCITVDKAGIQFRDVYPLRVFVFSA